MSHSLLIKNPSVDRVPSYGVTYLDVHGDGESSWVRIQCPAVSGALKWLSAQGSLLDLFIDVGPDVGRPGKASVPIVDCQEQHTKGH